MYRTPEARAFAANTHKDIAEHGNPHATSVDINGTGDGAVETDVVKYVVTDNVASLQRLLTKIEIDSAHVINVLCCVRKLVAVDVVAVAKDFDRHVWPIVEF